MVNVTGKVTDSKNEPLLGVNIRVKGFTVLGTVTDINGRFLLRISENIKNPVLVFSFVGMETKEVPYNGKFMNVILNEGIELSEVVVTGIFNKARESFTGAATSITSKELKLAGDRSVLSSIRNIDPSFRIADNINLGSDPNNLPSITMRGNSSLPIDIKDLQTDSKSLRQANQPLFILDGFEVTLTRIMDLDENKIESITLLKDASSTALYGTRGSNGVVVITTRRVEPGRLQITYNASLNIEAPDLRSYNLMNAREKLAYEQAAGLYSYPGQLLQEQTLLDTYNQRKLNVERGVDTYWLKYPVRTGVGYRQGLSLEGGNETMLYGANLSYKRTAGAMKGSDRSVLEGSILLMYKIKNLSFRNELVIVSSTGKNSPYGSFDKWGLTNSYYAPYDEDGSLSKVLDTTQYFQLASGYQTDSPPNPLYDALLPSKNQDKYQDISNNFAIEWRILPELFVRGRFSFTSQTNRSDVYVSAKNSIFDNYSEEDSDRKGQYTYGSGNMFLYDADITLNYSKVFNDVHQLFAGLGYNITESKNEYYIVVGEGISVINMDFLGMAGKYQKDGRPGGSEAITRRVGGVFNGNYTYDRRYFVDFSGRVEGSSQFGADNRYAPFWSIGLGWNLYNEKFLKEDKFIDVARLRFSYGVTGSQGFNPYQALIAYKDNGGKSYRGWYGNSLMGLGNKDLGWQKTYQYNIGTEWQLWNNRIRFNIDVYKKLTDNLLTDINLPPSAGFGSYRANVGEVENKGFEISANIYLIQNRQNGLSWSVGGNIAQNKNTIKKISNSLEFLNEELLKDDSDKQKTINPSFLYKEGESINTIYAVKSKGIDPSNGQEIFVKQDGTETYIWDPRDKVACGTADPKIFGNLNTSVRYKGFTLAAYFGFTYGGYIYNSTLANKVENIYPYNNADRRAFYDRWKAPGDIVTFKSIQDFSTTNATSRFVMKENSFSCQSLSLTYEFSSQWTRKHLFCQYLSLKGYIEDLFYTSTIKRERGLNYPYSRKFSMSLTARF